MAETKYSAILDLPPTLLRLKDLFELEEVVRRGMNIPEDKLSFSVTVSTEELAVNAQSVEDLLSLDLPATTARLFIRAYGWAGNTIDKSVSLTLYHNYISCHVDSYDETWFRGKLDQIRRFFSRHRPWYWWVNKYKLFICGFLAPLAGFSVTLLVAAGIRTGDERFLWGLIVPPFGFLLAFLVWSSTFSPYVRIELSESETKVSYETKSLAIMTLSLLVTLATFILYLALVIVGWLRH
jgi:hypothetical protein